MQLRTVLTVAGVTILVSIEAGELLGENEACTVALGLELHGRKGNGDRRTVHLHVVREHNARVRYNVLIARNVHYLAFFLTVVGAVIARACGWMPSGTFTLWKMGNAGYHRRGVISTADVTEYRLALPAFRWPRGVQLRMGHVARDAGNRDGRSAL